MIAWDKYSNVSEITFSKIRMKVNAETQTDAKVNTREIAIQTGQEGIWKTEKQTQDTILVSSGPYIPGEGSTKLGRASRTAKIRKFHMGTQTDSGSLITTPKEVKIKRIRKDGLTLVHLTPQTISDWMPGEGIEKKGRRWSAEWRNFSGDSEFIPTTRTGKPLYNGTRGT